MDHHCEVIDPGLAFGSTVPRPSEFDRGSANRRAQRLLADCREDEIDETLPHIRVTEAFPDEPVQCVGPHGSPRLDHSAQGGR